MSYIKEYRQDIDKEEQRKRIYIIKNTMQISKIKKSRRHNLKKLIQKKKWDYKRKIDFNRTKIIMIRKVLREKFKVKARITKIEAVVR